MASVLGVDLGGTKALLLLGFQEERVPTGPAFAPADLLAAIRRFLRHEESRLEALGLAVPGLVDDAGRVVACDVLPAFTGWNARTALREFTSRVAVMNDVSAAVAEEMHDAGPSDTAGLVMAGTAVGSAFLTEGHALRGAGGFAGELGYVPLAIDGQVKRLDDLAGGAALCAKLGVSPEELSARATAGDKPTLDAIRTAGEALGLGLATVINLFNPSRLGVGGGALELPGYWEAAEAAARLHALPDLMRLCRLSRVRAGARVAALGAIRVAGSRRS